MRLKKFLISNKLILLNIVLVLYVATNLIGGERGLVSYFEKKKIEAKLTKTHNELNIEIKDLKKKKQTSLR